MSEFKDKIWQEILDGNKHWKVSENTQEAFDLFEVTIVRPLEELRDEGRLKMTPIKRPTTMGTIVVAEVMIYDVRY